MYLVQRWKNLMTDRKYGPTSKVSQQQSVRPAFGRNSIRSSGVARAVLTKENFSGCVTADHISGAGGTRVRHSLRHPLPPSCLEVRVKNEVLGIE
jgi:hypothetical protein